MSSQSYTETRLVWQTQYCRMTKQAHILVTKLKCYQRTGAMETSSLTAHCILSRSCNIYFFFLQLKKYLKGNHNKSDKEVVASNLQRYWEKIIRILHRLCVLTASTFCVDSNSGYPKY